MSLGENIRERRKARGLTQEALGEALGMAAQTVSKWERDESMPDAALLPGLAEILGCSLDRLFDRPVTSFRDAAGGAKDWLLTLRGDERWMGALRLGRILQAALGGFFETTLSLYKDVEDYDDPVSQTGRCLGDGGFTDSSRLEDLPYLLLFPEPKEGWLPLMEEEDAAFWALMAKERVRSALKRIYAGEFPACFDGEWALSHAGLEEPRETLAELEALGVLTRRKVSINGKAGELWNTETPVGLLAILLLSKALREKGVGFNSDNRCVPWLRKKE